MTSEGVWVTWAFTHCVLIQDVEHQGTWPPSVYGSILRPLLMTVLLFRELLHSIFQLTTFYSGFGVITFVNLDPSGGFFYLVLLTCFFDLLFLGSLLSWIR